jgi:hypothetical protein
VESDPVHSAGELAQAVVLAEADDEEVGAGGCDLGENAVDLRTVDENRLSLYAGVCRVLCGQFKDLLETFAAFVQKLLRKGGVHGHSHIYVAGERLNDGDDAQRGAERGGQRDGGCECVL